MRFFFSGDKSSFEPIAQTVTIDFNVSLFSRSRVVWTSCLVVPCRVTHVPPIPFFTLNFLVFIIYHSKIKIICKRYLYGKFCALNDSACFLVNNIQIIYRIAVKIRTFQRESYLENSVLQFACHTLRERSCHPLLRAA